MELINTDFENWGTYLMKQFHSMYEKGERCDLEISCNKQVFLVHRLIMSACSDYVRELGDKQHIILPEEVSCKTLKTIIEFVYSGKITFHKEDKDDLLIAASLLNMRLLIELIKREDPSSYTISMDDDGEEKSGTESSNNGIVENFKTNSNVNYTEHQEPNISPGQINNRKRSETKVPKNKCSKNFVVLPPLHKFPYLQQKFSASRTYGLITNLTSPAPCRFEISNTELVNSSYRSTFEDVTYDTEKLFPNPDSLIPLESAHHQFLKKLKDSPSCRRSYSNALYSPFDKYTPPSHLKSDFANNKKCESVVSYPPRADVTVPVRKYQVHNNSNLKETSLRLSSAASPKEYKKSEVDKNVNRDSMNSTNVVEKRVRFAASVDVREIHDDFTQSIANDLESLPEPLVPSEIVHETSSVSTGDKLELIKLNNVSIESDFSNHQPSLNHSRLEESCALLNSEQNVNDMDALEDESNITSIMEVDDDLTSAVTLPPSCSTKPVEAANANDLNEMSLHSESIGNSEAAVVPSECFIDPNVTLESSEGKSNDDSTSTENSCVDTIDENAVCDTAKTNVSNAAEDVSIDTSLFTPLNTARDSNSSDLNSQVFALKVKGTESPAQLNKLVDLCKNNPLFKNKNIRFKIVPVKGAIRGKLKDAPLIGDGINKAIIVKRTDNLRAESAVKVTETAATTVNTVTAKPKPAAESMKRPLSDGGTNNLKRSRVARIENVSGPWECENCEDSAETVTFSSYFEYRNHLHSVHNEANNPVYCIHCGYKSLKRNMQLYHLLIKHNIAPPSHIKFPKCDKCEFRALNDYYLQKHLVCHPSAGMEYVCACKVAFRSSELLQKHMVSGDCKNSKSFQCGYCRCIFDRFVNLKAHMRVCMKERSKPVFENNSECALKTVSDNGKDYVSL